MASLRAFMKKQIGQIYAVTLEMLLEKCFFAKEQLSKEEALQTVGFLLGSVEKEAHKK